MFRFLFLSFSLASCRRLHKAPAAFGLLAILFILGGCSPSPLQSFYVPIIDLPPIQPVGEGDEPEVIKYDNIATLAQWVQKYRKEGWLVVGSGAWFCADDPLIREGERGFKTKGREVGADLVLWASQPAGSTQTTYVPIGVPNAPTATATPYGVIQNPSAPTVYNVPVAVRRIKQEVVFFVRPERICLQQAKKGEATNVSE